VSLPRRRCSLGLALDPTRECASERSRHRCAIRLVCHLWIVSQKPLQCAHDLATFESGGSAVHVLSSDVPAPRKATAKALAITSATILTPGSSSFRLASSRAADMSGPSARAVDTTSIATATPAATLYNLLSSLIQTDDFKQALSSSAV
jgi:hypothetical protein